VYFFLKGHFEKLIRGAVRDFRTSKGTSSKKSLGDTGVNDLSRARVRRERVSRKKTTFPRRVFRASSADSIARDEHKGRRQNPKAEHFRLFVFLRFACLARYPANTYRSEYLIDRFLTPAKIIRRFRNVNETRA